MHPGTHFKFSCMDVYTGSIISVFRASCHILPTLLIRAKGPMQLLLTLGSNWGVGRHLIYQYYCVLLYSRSKKKKTVTFPFRSALCKRKGATHSMHKNGDRTGTEHNDGNRQNVRTTKPTIVNSNKIGNTSSMDR